MKAVHQHTIRGLFKAFEGFLHHAVIGGLNAEQMRLLEETHKGFVRSGAALPAEEQERLREINTRLSTLTLRFGQNVLGETNAFKMTVENEEDLSGLPASSIEAAADRARQEGLDGKWVFTLHNPSVMPFLYNADNRELRREMQQAYINRGNMDNEFNNREILAEISNLRLERANMLGYDNHAHFTLEETMAGDIATVMDFVDQVWEPAIALAREEAEELQSMIYAEGHDFVLEQWDWRYYAEKVRRQKYDLDEQEVRQYFELNTVRDGIFDIVDKLWGLQFTERHDVPRYHEDVQVFEVLEADGSHLGVLYMDFHPRDSKRGGAARVAPCPPPPFHTTITPLRRVTQSCPGPGVEWAHCDNPVKCTSAPRAANTTRRSR